MFAAGGFVLGEAWLLLPVAWKLAVLALGILGACCLLNRRDKEGGLDGGGPAEYWMLSFLLMAALGAGRLEWDRRQSLRYERIGTAAEKTALRLTGRIGGIEAGDGENYEAVLRIKDAKLQLPEERTGYGDVLVYVRERPDRSRVKIGAKVAVEGRLERMERATNPGQFDYGAYAHALGIEGRMSAERVQVLPGGYSPLGDGILQVKEHAAHLLEKLCDSGDRGVFQAVLLGDRSALPEEVYDLYRKNGIAHLLAVSGLHISLIGLGGYHLLRKAGLGMESAGAAAAVVTVGYGILTGFSASVARAVVMVCLRLLADLLGRTYDLLSALAAAAFLILLQSPAMLFQAGFQLSFGAVLALGAVLPVLEERLGGNRAVLAGLAVQIVTFPIVAFHYFQYPVWGFFLNLAVIPLMGYVLLSGLAGILAGTAWLPAGMFCVGTGHYILKLYERLCRLAESLPGAVRITGRPGLWQIGLYAALWLVLMREGIRKEGGIVRRYGAAAAGILAGFLLLSPAAPSGLRATFLDVGQGDGICLETREMVLLADCGSTGSRRLGERVLEPFLKSRGIAKVDYAVVSHGDRDHISGLQYLLESDGGIEIGCLVLPWLGQEDAGCRRLAGLAEKAGTKVVWMKAGDRIGPPVPATEEKAAGEKAAEEKTAGEKTADKRIGADGNSLTLRCLYAGDERYREETNDHSLLLEVSYGESRLLLTGDISAEGEERWLRQAARTAEGRISGPVQLLKTAHHGSDSSTSWEFLDYVRPARAVISCGKDNSYGHPGEEAVGRLRERQIELFFTMDSGAVIAGTDGGGQWTVSGFAE